MQRKTPFVPNEFYHLYNRGTERRKIFMEHPDYARFMTLLYLSNNTESTRINQRQRQHPLVELFDIIIPDTLVDIGAYCLIPNHFHLLVREKIKSGISSFMKKLLTGYSMYFNIRRERTGPLFEGRFKAKHISKDQHFRHLFTYIHLNPASIIEPRWKENGIKDIRRVDKFLREYQYGSYQDYLGQRRPEGKILNCAPFSQILGDMNKPIDLKKDLEEWLEFDQSRKPNI